MAKWIALFSQTGSEIVHLSNAIGRSPDFILTNNMNEDKYKYHPELYNLDSMIVKGKHDVLMDYLSTSKGIDPSADIITLHGYLRILPEHVCSKYNIYNGHPGAINLYPELKGKDPQARTWENKGSYKFLGSVVHRVVPEVDAGEIVKSVYLTNTARSLDETFDMLKSTSLMAWKFAMKEIGL